jgi:recombinational DNA repair protein (RecF pathway)
MEDYLDFFQRHCEEEERYLSHLPCCAGCGEPITDETGYLCYGDLYCGQCYKWAEIPAEDEEIEEVLIENYLLEAY